MPSLDEIAMNQRQPRKLDKAMSKICRELTDAKNDNASGDEIVKILKGNKTGSDDEGNEGCEAVEVSHVLNNF